MKLNIILPSLFFLIVITIFNNNSTKEDLAVLEGEISNEKVELEEISRLKKKQKITKHKKQKLEALFNDGSIIVDYKKSSSKNLKVTVSNLKKDSLKKISKKILENPYVVKKFIVTKQDEYLSNLKVRVSY